MRGYLAGSRALRGRERGNEGTAARTIPRLPRNNSVIGHPYLSLFPSFPLSLLPPYHHLMSFPVIHQLNAAIG